MVAVEISRKRFLLRLFDKLLNIADLLCLGESLGEDLMTLLGQASLVLGIDVFDGLGRRHCCFSHSVA